MNQNEKALAALKEIVDCSRGPYVQNPKPFLIEALISCNELASIAIAALESQPVANHKLTGGPVYECESFEWGWGIRNKHGLVCKVYKPSKFQGQDERFVRETEEYRSVVEFIISALNGQPVAGKAIGEVVDVEAWREIDRLCTTLNYIKGIVERGVGHPLEPDVEIGIAVLDYIKELEVLRSVQQPQATAIEVGAHAEFVRKLYDVRMEPDKLLILIQLEKQVTDRQGGR